MKFYYTFITEPKEFRQVINDRGLTFILSAAIPAGKTVIDAGYEVSELNK